MGIKATYYGVKGYACMMRGDNKNARIFFEKALHHGLEKPNHLTYYGVLLLRTGEFEKSEKILKKALDLCPRDVPLYSTIKMNIAMCAWKLNDIDRSLELVESIFDNYKNSGTYGLYGFLLSEKQDYDAAIKINNEAIEYDDEDPVAYDNLGQVYYKMGDYAKAEENFTKALKFNSRLVDSLYYMGMIRISQDRLEDAYDYIEEAIDIPVPALSTVTYEKIEKEYDALREKLGITDDDDDDDFEL
ncbi:MAG: tetratricopeptide repeat protein [Clostridiales bacterium]|nr:tetratricopeptide repeat protein [Clostridiales bacterium]